MISPNRNLPLRILILGTGRARYLGRSISHTESSAACGDDPVYRAALGLILDGLTDLSFVVWENGGRYFMIAVTLEDRLDFRPRQVLGPT